MAAQKRSPSWNDVQEQMKIKKMKARVPAKGSAPSEIMVQKLSTDADSKQVYRPLKTREFVSFDYPELSLINIKKACGKHYKVPHTTIDVLVSNKGPSCTNIHQIPHRKDKVYLIRLMAEMGDSSICSSDARFSGIHFRRHDPSVSVAAKSVKLVEEVQPSVSLTALLKAGKLIKPLAAKEISLKIEEFNIQTQEWNQLPEKTIKLADQKFASGSFRDAFIAHLGKEKFVLKKYKQKAAETILEGLGVGEETHSRKQVQMHEVARYLAKKMEGSAPSAFGTTFTYNKVYLGQMSDGKFVTFEEHIPGTFVKYVNNDGFFTSLSCYRGEEKLVREKAHAFIHYTYEISNQKMMVLDIQGCRFNLCDPEIATSELCDENLEVLFCCGNLGKEGIKSFIKKHVCSNYCKMLSLKPLEDIDSFP